MLIRRVTRSGDPIDLRIEGLFRNLAHMQRGQRAIGAQEQRSRHAGRAIVAWQAHGLIEQDMIGRKIFAGQIHADRLRAFTRIDEQESDVVAGSGISRRQGGRDEAAMTMS